MEALPRSRDQSSGRDPPVSLSPLGAAGCNQTPKHDLRPLPLRSEDLANFVVRKCVPFTLVVPTRFFPLAPAETLKPCASTPVRHACQRAFFTTNSGLHRHATSPLPFNLRIGQSRSPGLALFPFLSGVKLNYFLPNSAATGVFPQKTFLGPGSLFFFPCG